MNKSLRIIVWMAFILLTLFSIATNPFANISFGDSAIFSYVGERWAEGSVPYVDYFDHKGPLIFFIDCIGLYIFPGSFLGIWLIECSFFIAGIVLIRAFGEKCFKGVEVLPVEFVAAGLVWMFLSSCYGNMTESYAYPLILVCVLMLIRTILESRRVTKVESFIYGCAFISLFLLRANMTVVAFVVATFYIHEWIRTRDFHYIVCCGLMTILGMLTVSMPFVIYFARHNALLAMWDASITFNLKYAARPWKWSNGFLPLFAIIGLNIRQILTRNGALRKALSYNLLFLVLTMFVLLKAPFYLHYFIIFIPGVVLPLMVSQQDKVGSSIACRSVMMLCGSAVLCFAFLGANLELGDYVKHIRTGGRISDVLQFKEGCKYKEVGELATLIHDRRSVLIFGAEASLYQYLDLSGNYKYFAHVCGVDNNKHIFDEYLERHIFLAKDSYIIVCKNSAPDGFLPLIVRNYDLVRDGREYALYERKEEKGDAQ